MIWALVTARAARELDEDLAPLEAAAQAAGIATEIVDWDQSGHDWSRYARVVLRSTWDYTTRLDEFLAWAERVSAASVLLNPLPVLRWNTDKRYLIELERAGVPITPTRVYAPGAPIDTPLDGEWVIKPSVGAGSRGARRFRNAPAEALVHARALQQSGQHVLVQPYLEAVDQLGETALIYFAGRFSHAIRKGPLLEANGPATRALFAPEHITARRPSRAELDLAERALAAVPYPSPLPYARVDLIPDRDGQPRVLELELTEPSLFFAHGPGSAARLVEAVTAWR